jgi:hypothetical protein
MKVRASLTVKASMKLCAAYLLKAQHLLQDD